MFRRSVHYTQWLRNNASRAGGVVCIVCSDYMESEVVREIINKSPHLNVANVDFVLVCPQHSVQPENFDACLMDESFDFGRDGKWFYACVYPLMKPGVRQSVYTTHI